MLHAILMFIGSAPSSTAGGIRTTTLAIIILGFIRYVKNKSSVRVFNRRIDDEIVARAFAVFTVSIILVFSASFVMLTLFNSYGGSIQYGQKSGFDFVNVFFEAASAFGTTGLSTGVTASLNVVSKLFLILLMFIGQFGVSSTLLV